MIKLKEAAKPIFKLWKITGRFFYDEHGWDIIGAVYAKDETEAADIALNGYKLNHDVNADELSSSERQKIIIGLKQTIQRLENPLKP